MDHTARRRLIRLITAFTSVAAIGCGGAEPRSDTAFPVTFVASSDPGEPLAGVAVSTNGSPAGITGADGTLHVQLAGREGSPIAISAACPEGYRDAEPIPGLTLRRVTSLDPSASAQGLLVSITCRPTRRRAVVVVRAGGDSPRAGIPVMIEGREIARTDRSGVAHFPMEMQPGERFQVMLATASMPELRPRDPSMMFTFPDQDEIFVFDQSFEVERPPPTRPRGGHGKRPPRPSLPLPVKISR